MFINLLFFKYLIVFVLFCYPALLPDGYKKCYLSTHAASAQWGKSNTFGGSVCYSS